MALDGTCCSIACPDLADKQMMSSWPYKSRDGLVLHHVFCSLIRHFMIVSPLSINRPLGKAQLCHLTLTLLGSLSWWIPPSLRWTGLLSGRSLLKHPVLGQPLNGLILDDFRLKYPKDHDFRSQAGHCLGFRSASGLGLVGRVDGAMINYEF